MFYKNSIVGIFLLIFVSQAHAFIEQEVYLGDEWKPLEVTGDAISWDVFAKTKENMNCKMGDDGIEMCSITPEYSNEIKELDGQEVMLMGYMFPLEQSEKQKNFLIGPYPLSCPFHYHIGPSQVVEVVAKEPLDFSYDPITVKGKLSMRFNKETGVFYYLENAVE